MSFYKNTRSTVLLAMVLCGCVEEDNGSLDYVLQESGIEREVEFKHPLSGKISADGLVLALEEQNSESGNRYAIEESIESIDDERAITRSGVVEYHAETLTDAEHLAYVGEKALRPHNVLKPVAKIQ